MGKKFLLDAIAVFGIAVPVAVFANEVLNRYSVTWLFGIGAIVTVASGLWIVYRIEYLNKLEIKQNA